jgi:DNA invertase Pin-like site-specific DNA recombinase
MGIDHRLAVVIYDEAESGTKTFRSEFERLEQMVRNGEIRLLAVDDQSRLTRANNAFAFITDVVFSGGRWLSTGEGIDTIQPGWELRVKVMELHNSTTILELGRRVRRGQAGRLIAGLTAGDYPYGYESFLVNPEQVHVTARGPKPEKDIRINEEEARWIREIFTWFLSKWSLNAIAEELTRLGVSRGRRFSKRSRVWTHQQVRNILANQKYIGLWVWGKTTTIRNSKGKTKQIPVPEEQWVRRHRPDLRIVEQDVWDKAQEGLIALDKLYGYKEGQKKRGPRVHHTVAYPSGILHGLVVCRCGTRLHYRSSGPRLYLGCPNAGNAPGMCGMRTWVPVDKAKVAIIGAISDSLMAAPNWVDHAIAAMQRTIANRCNQVPQTIEADERQLTDLIKQANNLIDGLAKSGQESALVLQRVADLEQSAEKLRTKIAEDKESLGVSAELPDPTWVKQQLRNMVSILEEEQGEAAALLRQLLGKVSADQVLPPGKTRGYTRIFFELNRLEALLAVVPSETRQRVLGTVTPNGVESEMQSRFCIDLGEPSDMDKWAPLIAQWRIEKVTWKEIQARTGLGSGPAYVAWKRFVEAQKDRGSGAQDVA